MANDKKYIVHVAATDRFPERWVSKIVGGGKFLLSYKKEEALEMDKSWADKAAKTACGKVEEVKQSSK